MTSSHQPTETDLIRLNKRLADLGFCSRREADSWIERGWVKVNGQTAGMGLKVSPQDQVSVDKKASAAQEQLATILLHKPIGVVSGQAEHGYQNAAAIIGARNLWLPPELKPSSARRFSPQILRGLAPAGRLDIDSTGLLVLTQDGRVAKTIIGEDSTISKEYLVRVAWQGQNLGTTASIGLTTSQPPHKAFDELLSKTDAACFEAKELGGNRLFATEQDAEGIQVRTRLMHSAMAAREALDQRRVELWCQPIVDLRSPRPEQAHFEVLMRWRDAEGNLRPPAELIAAAERYRLGPRLDRYVCGEVLAWLEAHPEAAAKVEQCSINLGAATLTDEDFSDYFANRLRRSPLRPEQFCLEITETSVVRDMTRTRHFISRMRDLGCRFALDDFGTGFCSFGYLRDLDVDYLKIDGSFVRDLDHSGLSEAVVRSITEIAHLLGKRAVGEQAETELQLQHLRALGVDYAQGYVFQRPQPIEAFFGLPEKT